MKIVSTSYITTPEFTDPVAWLKRINFYTGILEELAKLHDVASIERVSYEGRYDQNGVHYFFLMHRRKVIRLPWRMHLLIKNYRPDVVFVNGLIYPLQIIQLRLKLGRRVKIIVLHRAEKPFSGFKKYLQKIADRCIDAYLFSSVEFGNQWIQNGIIKDGRKIHEVMQASSGFRPHDKTVARSVVNVEGSPVYLWVGRLDANKDPLTVVTAFIHFLKHEPLARLYMIYQTEELLEEVIRKLSIDTTATAAIQLIGKVPHEQLQDWYSSADFIISGSHYEGSGIAVCEAMSCGCVPILTNIASFRSMSGNGRCGIIYESGNDQVLLSALIKSKQLDLASEKEKVLMQFNEELSFSAIARKINRVIEEMSQV
jgi:glycosyltransferase involved in cell wall biosynthesis